MSGDLQAKIAPPAAAAGKREVTITLTNTTDHQCELTGFPRIEPSLHSAIVPFLPNQQLPGMGRQTVTDNAPTTLELPPGGSAAVVFEYHAEGAGGKCVTWDAITVTVPGDTVPLVAADGGGSACRAGFGVGPFRTPKN